LSIPVTRLTLFESRLSPRGPTYIPVERWTLGSDRGL
jgi:2'-5' RNA ligase